MTATFLVTKSLATTSDHVMCNALPTVSTEVKPAQFRDKRLKFGPCHSPRGASIANQAPNLPSLPPDFVVFIYIWMFGLLFASAPPRIEIDQAVDPPNLAHMLPRGPRSREANPMSWLLSLIHI